MDRRTLEVRTGGKRRRVAVPESVATFGRRGGTLISGSIELAAGDRLRLFRRDGSVVAVVREGESAGRVVPTREGWVRFRGLAPLRRSVATLYPGFELSRMEVVSRGVSHRVGVLRLVSTTGESVLIEGLAVRWTLDLPDTLFDMRAASQDRQSGWKFEGRGHGHGVGMCQIGAAVMGQRGQTYREILAHYYIGAKLGRLKTG